MTQRDGFEAEALAAAGVIMDAGDLPYPVMPAPHYRVGQGPNWALRQAMFAVVPGYFSGPRPVTWPTFLLVRDGMTWMSLTPGEVESQIPHLAAAHGTVVVCGLGMGVMAYAVAARQAVKRLIVVEKDPEVLDIFHQCTDFESWPQRHKIELVQADACEYRQDGVDFLYADIWPFYRMDCMITDFKRMHANIPAPSCGYWGQELDMVDWAISQGTALEDFSAQHVQDFQALHDLPLIGLENPDYPLLCRKAAVNPAIGAKRRPIAA